MAIGVGAAAADQVHHRRRATGRPPVLAAVHRPVRRPGPRPQGEARVRESGPDCAVRCRRSRTAPGRVAPAPAAGLVAGRARRRSPTWWAARVSLYASALGFVRDLRLARPAGPGLGADLVVPDDVRRYRGGDVRPRHEVRLAVGGGRAGRRAGGAARRRMPLPCPPSGCRASTWPWPRSASLCWCATSSSSRRGCSASASDSVLEAPRPELGGLELDTDVGYYYVVLVIAVAASLLVLAVSRGRLGRLLRAMADAPAAVNAHGANTNVSKFLVFCVSAFLAGIGGAISHPDLGQHQLAVVRLDRVAGAGSRAVHRRQPPDPGRGIAAAPVRPAARLHHEPGRSSPTSRSRFGVLAIVASVLVGRPVLRRTADRIAESTRARERVERHPADARLELVEATSEDPRCPRLAHAAAISGGSPWPRGNRPSSRSKASPSASAASSPSTTSAWWPSPAPSPG